MRPLETNLNFISSLPDDPSTTTAALKQEFDKAGNVIKDFINDTLEPDISDEVDGCLEAAKAYADSAVEGIDMEASNISYDNTSSGMSATNVQNAINELKSGISSTATSADSKTRYDDLVLTQHSSGVLSNGHGGYAVKTISVSKPGYAPIAIAGFTSSSTNHYNNTPMGACLTQLYLTDRANGSCKIYGETYVADNSAWTYSSQFLAFVLWVKVR